MGAYSRWALIRGWALIRINTVGLVLYLKLGQQQTGLMKGSCITSLVRIQTQRKDF